MLDELRCFVWVVREGTFTRAARRAHLSQPALSASIGRLEAALGARLFDRGRRGAVVTAAGAALLPHAQGALAALEDARRAVQEVAGVTSGEVRVGAGTTVCGYVLPRYTAAFRSRYPSVRLRLREAATPEVLEALDAGEIDLGIVTHERGELWFVDTLVLVAAKKTRLPPSGHTPFVTLPRGTTTRELLDHHFPRADVVMELGSIDVVKSHVRAGVGIALVSGTAVAGDIAAGRLALVPSAQTPIQRPLSIVHRGLDRLSPAAAALRAMLVEAPPSPPVLRRRRR